MLFAEGTAVAGPAAVDGKGARGIELPSVPTARPALKAQGSLLNRSKRHLGIIRAKKKTETEYFEGMKAKAQICLLSSCVAIGLTVVVLELQTNWWYLKPNGTSLRGDYRPVIAGLKVLTIFCNLWNLLYIIRYQVLKHNLNMAREGLDLDAKETLPTIWNIPKTLNRVIREGLFTMISPIPFYNGTIFVRIGLSRHDPDAVYRIDIFIFIFMLLFRCKFLYRYIYIREDVFSKDLCPTWPPKRPNMTPRCRPKRTPHRLNIDVKKCLKL